MRLLFECEIPGRPIVKKNTKRIYGAGKRKRVLYSPKFVAWERAAIAHLHREAGVDTILSEDLEAHFVFYFKNHQGEADVSNLVEGPQDLLEKTGIITNDRIIKKIIAEKRFGFEPKTVIKLYLFTGWVAEVAS